MERTESYTLHPQFRFFCKTGFLLLIWLLAAAIVMGIFSENWFLVTILFFGVLLLLIAIFLPVFKRDNITLGAEGISGVSQSYPFKISWSSIQAAHIGQDKHRQAFLFLWLPDEIVAIPLRWFDSNELQEKLSLFIPPERLRIETWEHLREAKLQEDAKFLESVQTPVSVSCYLQYKMVGIVGMIGFILLSVIALLSDRPITVICISPFAFLGLILWLLHSQSLQFDRKRIMRRWLFFRNVMDWADIITIRTSSGDSRLILEGNNKRLVIAAFEHWEGKEKQKAIAIFQAMIDQRNIKAEEDRWMPFKIITSKNTGNHAKS